MVKFESGHSPSRDFLRHRRAAYDLACYRYYGGRAVAVGGVFPKVRYRVGLDDLAVSHGRPEGVADRRQVRQETIRRNLRLADDAPGKVLNEMVRIVAVALADAIGDDGLLGCPQYR